MRILTGKVITSDNWKDAIGLELRNDGEEGVYVLTLEDILNVYKPESGCFEVVIQTKDKNIKFMPKKSITYYQELRSVEGLCIIYTKEKPVEEEVTETLNLDLIPTIRANINSLTIRGCLEIESKDFMYVVFKINNDWLIPVNSDVNGNFEFKCVDINTIEKFITNKIDFEDNEGYKLLRFTNKNVIDFKAITLRFETYNDVTHEFNKKRIESIREIDKDNTAIRIENETYFIKEVRLNNINLYFMKLEDEEFTGGDLFYEKKIFAKSELSKKTRTAFSFFEI